MQNNNALSNYSDEIMSKENKKLREENLLQTEKLEALFNMLINLQHSVMARTSSITILQNLDMVTLRGKINEIQEQVYDLVYRNAKLNTNIPTDTGNLNNNFNGTMKSSSSNIYNMKNFRELPEEIRIDSQLQGDNNILRKSINLKAEEANNQNIINSNLNLNNRYSLYSNANNVNNAGPSNNPNPNNNPTAFVNPQAYQRKYTDKEVSVGIAERKISEINQNVNQAQNANVQNTQNNQNQVENKTADFNQNKANDINATVNITVDDHNKTVSTVHKGDLKPSQTEKIMEAINAVTKRLEAQEATQKEMMELMKKNEDEKAKKINAELTCKEIFYSFLLKFFSLFLIFLFLFSQSWR